MSRVSYQLLGKQGALGNQLWEIAGTYGIARERGLQPVFPQWAYATWFSVPEEFFVDSFLDTDTDLGEGYLQDMSHWSDYAAEIGNMFEASQAARSLIFHQFGYVGDLYTSVHVRRGNNVTPQYASHHPVMSLDYYEEAMDLTGGPFRVFSDSPEWCAKQSLFKDCEVGMGPPADVDVMELTKYDPLPSTDAAIDLLTMTRSRKIIMSNSSFSWWAAFLAGPDTQVVYPEKWYGEPLAHIDTSVMFDQLWAKNWTAI